VGIAALMLLAGASVAGAAKLNGTVKVGNIFLDETGDRSTVQETFDIYDGFAVSQVLLDGSLQPQSRFVLDLRDINLDSRQGNFNYRLPGLFKVRAAYDQNRYVFDPGRGVTSERKNWQVGLQVTPMKSLVLSGDLNRITRTGDRLSFPPEPGTLLGTVSSLGTRYDNALLNSQFGAEYHRGRAGGAVSVQLSDYSDDLNGTADRKGQVWAARLYAPMPFYNRWNNLFRASYGTRKLTDGGVEYKMSSFQYTGILAPRESYQLRYAFEASRVKDNALDLQTDRIQNDLDATWFHKYGNLNAGFGYETNDDDITLTDYMSWHAGGSFRPDKRLNVRFEYNGRVKNDQEDLTLLKDIESASYRGRLEIRPNDRITLGGEYAKRRREMPDIQVVVSGITAGAFARYEQPKWGAASLDYTHAIDEYDDRLAPFNVVTAITTARVDLSRIKNLDLASGVTYLDIGRDLDIEKSIVFVEGGYKFAGRYHLDAKYNVYNYDDYILLDRYYTANVVRVNLGYDL